MTPNATSPAMLIDIHTHSSNPFAGACVVDCSGKDIAEVQGKGVRLSRGIHPAFITRQWRKEAEIIESMAERRLVDAVGECGFDRTSAVDVNIQEEVFRAMADVSRRLSLPMIVHCVHAADVLLKYSRMMPAEGAWIVHGFRGKPTAMRQLLDAGFSVSFGAKANAESMAECDAERLFLETDTATPETLKLVYDECSRLRGEDIAPVIERNFHVLFD